MSHITTYPVSLKQLDLSHNSITVWPSLPQVETIDEHIACFGADQEKGPTAMPRISGCGLRNIVLHALCTHRRHVKLDNLRTLVLADNCLDRIHLTTDHDDDPDWVRRLIFTILSGLIECFRMLLALLPAAYVLA